MKNLIFCFVVASSSFFLSAVFAEDLLNGCKFNEWNDINGKPKYYQVISKDYAGVAHTVYWLKQAESGKYSNEGDYDKTTFVINKSPAVAACKKKRLHLPTKEEFEALSNCFEPDVGFLSTRFLSTNGLKGLYSKLPDMENRWFWSSSAHSGRPEGDAFFFDGYSGGVGSNLRDSRFQVSVRCVGR